MTTPPAVVTIQDLPTGTTVTGTELLEVVQTSGGVANSVQLSLSNIFGTTLGALPSGGATGQLLKSQGSGLLASWANVASMVTASTGLAEAGSTTIALSLASTAGLSVLAVAATGSAVPTAIAGTAAQTLRINDAGTVLGFGALNLGSSAAVSGVLPGANYSAANLAIGGAGGVQGVLPGANYSATNLGAGNVAGGVQGFLPGTSIVTATISTAQISTAGGAAGRLLGINTGGTTQWLGGMVLLNTLSPSNVATAGDTTSFTNAFRNYWVTLENVVPVNSNVILQLQVATSGAAFVSGGYVAMVTVDSAAVVSDVSTTTMLLSGTRATTTVGNGTTYGVHGSFRIFNPASVTFRKHITGETSYLNGTASGTTNLCVTQAGGYFDGNINAVTGLQFSFNSGNIQTGTIKVYGMA